MRDLKNREMSNQFQDISNFVKLEIPDSHKLPIAIIGAGGAGLTAAFYAVGLGKKVALFEAKKVGGECTWSGCIPSKALIKMSKKFYDFKDLHNLPFFNQAACFLNF